MNKVLVAFFVSSIGLTPAIAQEATTSPQTSADVVDPSMIVKSWEQILPFFPPIIMFDQQQEVPAEADVPEADTLADVERALRIFTEVSSWFDENADLQEAAADAGDVSPEMQQALKIATAAAVSVRAEAMASEADISADLLDDLSKAAQIAVMIGLLDEGE